MPQVPSHYDNLKVPQDAPLDAIRAAYKQLARQYHPDRNSNSAESHSLMQAINASFEVLADPARRANYDEWLARLGSSRSKPLSVLTRVSTWIRSRRGGLTDLVDYIEPVREITAARWIARAAFVAFVLWALNLDRKPTLQADTPPFSSFQRGSVSRLPTEPVFHRPPHAPNGASWPIEAAEIADYPVDRNDGKSVITMDNSRNPADVFVKLISLDGELPAAVRHVYVPARGVFKCKDVRKGIKILDPA
jgi:hypothetical protein